LGLLRPGDMALIRAFRPPVVATLAPMTTLTVLLPGDGLRTFQDARASVTDAGVLTVWHTDRNKAVKTAFSPAGWSEYNEDVTDA